MLISDIRYDGGIDEIKSPENLSIKSSFVIHSEPKADKKAIKSVKNRQQAALKSFQERPKSVREKAKSNLKTELKPHALGTRPNYLKNRKDSILKRLSFSEGSKPVLNDVLSKKLSKPIGDTLQSSTTIFNEQEETKAEGAATIEDPAPIESSTKLVKKKSEINELRTKNERLQKQLNEAKAARDTFENDFKQATEKVKNLETKLSKVTSEQKRNINLEVKIANLIQDKNDLSAEISKVTTDNGKLKTKVEQLKNELKAKGDSIETLMAEKKQLQASLEHERKSDQQGKV